MWLEGIAGYCSGFGAAVAVAREASSATTAARALTSIARYHSITRSSHGLRPAPPPPWPLCFVLITGSSQGVLRASINIHGRRYDMPIERPAAEIEP